MFLFDKIVIILCIALTSLLFCIMLLKVSSNIYIFQWKTLYQHMGILENVRNLKLKTYNFFMGILKCYFTI